ncbi:MAG: hypothetical protein JWP59_3670 [Massilia sp.]|nr:hypothetical protein [Massilia sp.]
MQNFSSLARWAIPFSLALCTCNAGAVPPAVNLPNGLNLGGTSFLDGFGGQPGDLALQGYYSYTHSTVMRTENGDSSPLFNQPKVTSSAYIFQTLYQFPTTTKVMGGSPGLDLMIPVVNLNASFAPPPPGPGLSLQPIGSGVGDITAGLFVQWDPALVDGNPFFVARAEVFAMMPTGRYSPRADMNIGNNQWALGAMVATTFLLGPKWEVSLRPQYVYSFKNTDPASSLPLDPWVADTQAGQAASINFAASYKAAQWLRIGLNGYYLRQLTDDQINGQTLRGSRETALGFGPGFMADVGKSDKVWLNLYRETSVRNRFSNDAVATLRWIHIF